MSYSFPRPNRHSDITTWFACAFALRFVSRVYDLAEVVTVVAETMDVICDACCFCNLIALLLKQCLCIFQIAPQRPNVITPVYCLFDSRGCLVKQDVCINRAKHLRPHLSIRDRLPLPSKMLVNWSSLSLVVMKPSHAASATWVAQVRAKSDLVVNGLIFA